jgi:peptide/nickel transport system substrate-binding protein/oligopeptide transport system substrate-binding protein
LNRTVLFVALAALGFPLAAATDPVADPAPLRVNFGSSSVETDPAKGQTALEAQVLTALYEGLVVYDPLSLRPLPGAAQSWTFADDGLKLTFNLRAGLTYEDGTPLTAQDFRDSWIRILNPATNAPFAALLDPIQGAQAWREGKLHDAAQLGIQTPDDRTLVLTLAEPAPHLVAVLCHYAFVPVQAAWRASAQTTPPPANGPYRLVSQETGRWILEKNPRYWDADHVALPGLDLRFDDNAVAVTRAFKEGTFDWVADGVDTSATIGSRYLSLNALFGTSFFYFKTDKAPWNDPRVRQALILLLPLEELRKPYLQPTSVLIPQFEGYPKVEGTDKGDHDKALALLADAGFPGGQGLPALTVALPNGEGNDQFVETFRQAWKEIGLTVNRTVVEGNYYDKLATLDHTIGYFSWIGDFLDPITFLVLWKGGSSLNSFAYADPAYDALLTKAAGQKPSDRLKTLSEAEKQLLDGGLLIPLSHTPGLNLIDREEIGGWYPNPLDIHPFKNLYRKPAKPMKDLAGGQPDLGACSWPRGLG